MSHSKERAEKTCLNCNTQLVGLYCHVCGQENIEPRETVAHLATHFFNDITHFDGKFFDTLGLLIRKPGFLPRAYMLGKRASYLNPIRMYIFTSALFFLVAFSVFHISEESMREGMKVEGRTLAEYKSLGADSLRIITARINRGVAVPREGLEQFFENTINTDTGFIKLAYGSRQAYDSAITRGVIKPGWISRHFFYKELEISQKYHHSTPVIISAFSTTFMHSLPQLLVVSLPVFALLLKFLYWRKKEFYYVNHGIFSIHFYIFVFICLLVSFSASKLATWLQWTWLTAIPPLLSLAMIFYLYKAMRNFYGQGRGKTILKFLLLYISSIFMMVILFAVFLLFSFMKI